MVINSSKKAWIYAILILYALCNLYPIIWMVMNSFKTDQDIALRPFSLPLDVTLENYIQAWNRADLGPYFVNSILVSVGAVFVTVLFGALTSFFLSRFQFKGKSWMYTYFILGMLIPVHATLVPIFILEQKLGILNTWASLILPYTAFHLPITIFVLVSFMNAFHRDIEESAIIDGCGIYQLFLYVIFPMTLPALSTVIILNFIYNWNEFSFALVLVNDKALKTLPLAIAGLAGEFTRSVGTQMAALTMALMPTIVIYLFLQKQLVKGMTAGAVKG